MGRRTFNATLSEIDVELTSQTVVFAFFCRKRPDYCGRSSISPNLLEARAALKVMRRWETSRDGLEVRPADVVLMDGPVVPQDRDSKHYAQSGSYGRIVRDLIEVNHEIMQKSRDDGQVIAGVVENSPRCAS